MTSSRLLVPLNATVCMLGKCRCRCNTGGEIPNIRKAHTLYIDSGGVTNLASLYCRISFITTPSFAARSTEKEARSCPLYMYLYKYLSAFMLEQASTLMCQLHLISSPVLYKTTHLLSNTAFLTFTRWPSSLLLYIGYESFPCCVAGGKTVDGNENDNLYLLHMKS